MYHWLKPAAVVMALSLLVGCPKTPTGAPKTASTSPAKLVSQLAMLRASTLVRASERPSGG